MTKRFHKILGKFFLFCTACAWFGCDNSNGEFPANPPDNFANENSSSNEKNLSSEQLSSNAGLSSSSVAYSSSFVGPKPFIDVEQELAKIKPIDTTGLRGKCIPEYEYCEMINGWSSHYAAKAHAASIAINKLEDQHKDTPDYWYGSNYCYRTLLSGLGNAPVYGVPECPISGSTPCETNGNGYSLYNEVHIDDAYMEALQRKDKGYYETVKKTLEEINQGMEECN
jgi:hypothetical protein